MTLLTGWPAGSDDSGDGQTGTVLNATYFSAQKSAIETLVHSSTNPSLSPAQTTDEVVAARGNMASLDARISAVVDDDGVAVQQAGQATVTQLQGGLGAVNLVGNDDFLVWPAGDTAAPVYWTLVGGGAAVQRCGTALADTNTKIGDFCQRLTRAGADCRLDQALLPSGTPFGRATFVRSRYLVIGCWVKCATPNVALISVYDGATTGSSSYHAGDGNWTFISKLHTISASATELTVRCEVRNTNVAAYFSGFVAMLVSASGIVLQEYAPSPFGYGYVQLTSPGTLTTGTTKDLTTFHRAGIVKDVNLRVKTAPTGQALIADVNTFDGAAFTSMFSTRPQIAAAGDRGAAQPDSTYARRCLRHGAASLAAGGEITLDIDQVGSGTAGADLFAQIRIGVYNRPFERFLGVAD
jgi:hypothetical protein